MTGLFQLTRTFPICGPLLPLYVLAVVMGGGGKGMRIVYDRKELESDIRSAQQEAKRSFGDERVLIEKYVQRPRHVEVRSEVCHQFGHGLFGMEREAWTLKFLVVWSDYHAWTPTKRQGKGQANRTYIATSLWTLTSFLTLCRCCCSFLTID